MDITVQLSLDGAELFYLSLKNYRQKEKEPTPFEQAFDRASLPPLNKPKYPPESGDLTNYRN